VPASFACSHFFLSKIVNMSNVVSEKPATASELEEQPKGGPVYDVGEKVDFDRAGAINAEDVEHNMTVLEAVKAYPAASWWAFVMSCTIVSSRS
jgi:SP family general alpha glucoside:H+ symporter-like MFS transporter